MGGLEAKRAGRSALPTQPGPSGWSPCPATPPTPTQCHFPWVGHAPSLGPMEELCPLPGVPCPGPRRTQLLAPVCLWTPWTESRLRTGTGLLSCTDNLAHGFLRSTPCQPPCHAPGTASYNKAQPLCSRRRRPGCLLTTFQNIPKILTCRGVRASIPAPSAERDKSLTSTQAGLLDLGAGPAARVPLHTHPGTHSLSFPLCIRAESGLPMLTRGSQECVCTHALTGNHRLAGLAVAVCVGQGGAEQEWDHQDCQEHLDPEH